MSNGIVDEEYLAHKIRAAAKKLQAAIDAIPEPEAQLVSLYAVTTFGLDEDEAVVQTAVKNKTGKALTIKAITVCRGPGASAARVDVWKDGTTILSEHVTLTAAGTIYEAAVADTALAADAILTVHSGDDEYWGSDVNVAIYCEVT
jgi:hypothetical protein